MPANMISKTAEALALRKAFPNDLKSHLKFAKANCVLDFGDCLSYDGNELHH